ncbi:hypothetical protein FLB_10470 [Flavobacterium succinicans]|uniref:Uncharacterized protein n=1 Tax=Flavobacterium succinicans TaxID=29536 RepID=A0A199XSZ9_9FLAO|nr:hypothetical protein FLB_10470 [Flavobacterium succinicans]
MAVNDLSIANATFGPVIVKFLLTVQKGVLVKVAVMVYVPAAKLVKLIGPAEVALPVLGEGPIMV